MASRGYTQEDDDNYLSYDTNDNIILEDEFQDLITKFVEDDFNEIYNKEGK